MSLRSNLFIKTFAGFWLATLAIVGSWLLAAQYFESTRMVSLREEWQGPPEQMPRFMLRLNYSLENLGAEELPGLVRRVEADNKARLWLLQRDGSDLLGREVPEQVVELASQLRGRRRRAMAESGRERLFAHDIYNGELGHFRAVTVIRHPRSPLLRTLGANPSLRIGIAIAVSGLICFGLSRLMTRRIRQVQLAARKVAEGELQARIAVRPSGGDETDELARDFNLMAEQLQERLEAQRRLLADVSHELRSPLARLRVALALAQDDRTGEGEYLARIDTEAGRLEELIGQLLDSQSGSSALLDSHLDLVVLLDTLCQDTGFEVAASGRHVKLETDLSQALVASSGDMLRKSFENILRNALQHTPPGSTVGVKLQRQGDEYLIVVRDRGPGVPEPELSKIFETFYRVDTARQRETGGYGLGLSIARRAVAQHGGNITARNAQPGLQVSVRLPVWEADTD